MAARYAALYAAESRELLAAATRDALALERDPADAPARVDGLFRAVHTLKGMAAAMGYAAVESLAHEAEGVLARARDGALAPTPALIDALLAAVDALEEASDRAVSSGAASDVSHVVARLRAAAAGPAPDRGEPRPPAAGRALVVRVTVAADAPLPAVRAFMAVTNARALGDVEACEPPADALARGDCDGTVTFRLTTAAPDEEVERAVRAAGDVAAVDVRPATAPARSPADPPRAGRGRGASTSVRVELPRLDALVDLVGELSIARARLAAAAARAADPELASAVAEVARVVAGVQEQALAVRMSPVGEAFERYPRVVRDAARALGKRASLVVHGGDVSLDRAVLDAVAEPLAHLLRNAVAHGIETPAERVAAGKPAEGRVVVDASRDRDAVVVTVSDDGRGVDRAAVLRRAVAGGIVEASRAELRDDELLACIAAPGLSTASEVTSVAGRGVGVDAVLASVRAVGGSVTLRTRDGEGTRIAVRLPVTLAIARALLVRDAGERYALPLTHVRETADLTPERVRTVRGREVFLLRDEVLPLVRLARAVGAPGHAGTASGHAAGEVAVVEAGGRAAAVAVDAFLGQDDFVVKRMPAVRSTFRIFAGATILDDGAPALILDAPAFLHHTLS